MFLSEPANGTRAVMTGYHVAMARLAVIDIGTNTLLLLVVDTAGPGAKLTVVHDACEFGRLGKALDATGALCDESIQRSLAIARSYADTMKRLAVERVAVVGTQALREATNAVMFTEPAEELLGAPIEIIAGEREAELVYTAVARNFPHLAAAELVIADVGGGSTEIIVGAAGQVQSYVSVPIGSVRMTERHLTSDPPAAHEVDAMYADIDRMLAPLDLPIGVPVVGTAGTATTIAAIELQLTEYDPHKVQGLALTLATIDQQLAHHLERTVAQRKSTRGLEAARADVIPGGTAIFARLLRRVSADRFVISDRGVRWGLAYELAERELAAARPIQRI